MSQPVSVRSYRSSVVAGVAVLLVVLLLGGLYLATRSTSWSAQASLVVLPGAGEGDVARANYYETLSRGQIVSTFAEILRLQRFEEAAAQELGLGEAELEQVATTVEVIAGTAMIVLTATAEEPALAESLVDGIVAQWQDYLEGFDSPYDAELVSFARGTAEQAGIETTQFVLVLAVVAVAAAVAAQQAVYQLTSHLRQRRPAAHADRPPLAALPASSEAVDETSSDDPGGAETAAVRDLEHRAEEERESGAEDEGGGEHETGVEDGGDAEEDDGAEDPDSAHDHLVSPERLAELFGVDPQPWQRPSARGFRR
jgi:capsular polysaccharide biosynthesis protein